MRRLLNPTRFLLLTAFLNFFWANAQRTECLNVTATEATGYGIAGQSPNEQFEQALASSLASAITQVRGVYLNSERELVETLKEVSSGGDLEVRASSEFREEVSQRFSGFVVGYNLLERMVQGGLVTVSIRAGICMDPRIALALEGPADVVGIFAGELAETIGETGWKVLSSSAQDESSSNPWLAIGLEAGASYIAQGQMQVRPLAANERTVSYMVALDVSLVDVRSLEIVGTLSLSQNGVGYTDAEAKQDAVSKLSGAVAKDWTQLFLAPEQRQVSTIRVHNISRSGTRYTLQDTVERISGVIAVTSATYDESARTVTLEAELSADLCSVVEELSRERRVVLQVEQCGGNLAELNAVRE